MADEAIRSRRKVEHVEWVRALPDGPDPAGFDDLLFVHNALPEIDAASIDTSITFFGHRFRFPLIIGSMTGGADEVTGVNRALARAAAARGVGMAVGSQKAALRDRRYEPSYAVVREENPDGFIVANVGADATPEEAAAAVEMVAADALAVHLNPAQELFMPEGDRDFGGHTARIAAIAAALPVPVIVKETGCGLSREVARRLIEAGAAALETAGKGGTNFIAVETGRAGRTPPGGFLRWGIPSAASLCEVVEAAAGRVPVIASGGLRDGLDLAKAFALGADAVAMAGPFLRACLEGGAPAVAARIEELEEELRTALHLLGVTHPHRLRTVPLVVGGATALWLERRGLDPSAFARR